jgi:serine/threonine protein kinase
MESTESPPPPTLISPFEQAVLQKEDHHSIVLLPHAPHLPHPHLFHESNEEHQFVAETTVLQTAPAAAKPEQSTEHQLLTRARQKAKSNFVNSPLLQDEYIFPRFSVHELKLGRVLGRGGFGTVLAVEKFEIESNNKPGRHRRGLSGSFSSSIFRHSKLHGGDEKHVKEESSEVRLVKSMDALGDLNQPVIVDVSGVEAVALEESKSKRKRRSVSLGFGQRHDFFRRGKRGGDGAQNDKENQQLQQPSPKHQQSSENGKGNCDQKNTENVLADTAVTAAETLNESLIVQRPSLDSAKQRPSLNFSFVSWRDSVPGQEGRDAIDESDLRFLNWVEEADAHHVHVPKSIDKSDELLKQDEKKVRDNEEKDKAQADTPVKSASPTHNQNNASPPSPRRRVILFSNNHNTNTSFDLNSSLRPNILQDKQYLSQHVTTSKGKSRYAVKIISPHIVRGDFKRFLQAAADMATETYFFSVLNHPHILKMRAVGQGDFFLPSYFLVLDRLYDTLSVKIEGAWKRQKDHLENDFFVWNRHRKGRGLWDERVGVARDLARALAYLHDMGIIYRDLVRVLLLTIHLAVAIPLTVT